MAKPFMKDKDDARENDNYSMSSKDGARSGISAPKVGGPVKQGDSRSKSFSSSIKRGNNRGGEC